VLDNCEHVLRAAARLVAAIEAQCARVRVLATSREGLNIAGEQLLVVPSLELPGDAGVETADECEAVRLFVERARAVKADFALDPGNLAGVVAICTRLDGVALAIERAAARIHAMNASELAGRLDRRFRLLSGGARVAIERHQTLRATIDWSYDLLSKSEQRLLARLAVFTGGCTLEAAEVVCAGDPIDADDVFESLARLVAHYLVVADDMKKETRYRLLDTIRQYGEERLVELEETDTLRARHADYYTELAGAARDHSLGPEQVEWASRLGREHDNLLTAMAFAVDTQDLQRAMRLLCQLPALGAQVNDPVVFDAVAVLALPGADEHPDSSVALLAAGFAANTRGDGVRALELGDHAIAVEARLGPAPDRHDWSLEVGVANLRAFVAPEAGPWRRGRSCPRGGTGGSWARPDGCCGATRDGCGLSRVARPGAGARVRPGRSVARSTDGRAACHLVQPLDARAELRRRRPWRSAAAPRRSDRAVVVTRL
jgi:predicted ATPase